VVLFAAAFVVAATFSFIHSVGAQPPGGGPPGGGPPGARPGGGPAGPAPAPVDSFVAERDSLMKDVLAHYAGKEKAPAESVFKNIKILKGVTVESLLRRMNFGYGRSLGVRCQHCHVLGHWADEDKPTKQVARDMMLMTGRINDELLTAIKNLKSEKPGVNCGTCHRGTARPGTGPMSQNQPPPQQQPGTPPGNK
jgi:hypothetical protein